MADITSWAGGIGQSLGDALVTSGNLLTSHQTWFVHHTGSNSYDGRDARWPFATLEHAITSSDDFDLIVMLDGHTETIATGLSPDARTLIGAGLSSGDPTVELTPNLAATSMLTFTSGGLYGVKIKSNAQNNSEPTVTASALLDVRGCRFEVSSTDQAGAMEVVVLLMMRDTEFLAVGTSSATRPAKALSVTGSAGVYLSDVTFDGGEYGFTTHTAVEDGTGAVWRAERISLLRGADITLESGSSGFFSDVTTTGSSRIIWPPVGG